MAAFNESIRINIIYSRFYSRDTSNSKWNCQKEKSRSNSYAWKVLSWIAV
jgi:hypothetical protein